jgi:circadian clock protein KaiC
VREVEADGARKRGLYVVKSRGMSHSNQIRELQITGQGVELEDGSAGMRGSKERKT